MERTMRVVLLLIRFLAIATITFSIGLCNGNPGWPPLCKESERQALLMFKQDLKDPANQLASWVVEEGSDCCSWTRVVCDHITGHIQELHLNGSYFHPYSDSYDFDSDSCFSGKINPSLLSLKHLNYLDLSNNCFIGTQIPSFLGSMTSLTHLDLGYSFFDGVIPHKLGNLSSLRYLNLSSFLDPILKVENLQWISGLSLLKHLDLSYVNLSKASDWLQVTNMLPSLVELHMSGCRLDQTPPLPTPNFTSLVVLYLSGNSFNSLMLRWVFSLKNLVSLYLSGCGFQGPIPSISQNITSLREIGLSYNSISLDPIPKWLFNQKDLALSLEANQLTGQLPSSIQNMTGLIALNLAWNEFNSTIPEWLYSLNNLESLLLSGNALRGEISSSIGNMTSLVNLNLDGNQLEGKIPNSLGHLCKLKVLDLSENHFTVQRPSEIFESLSKCGPDGIKSLSLRYTNISGPIPMSLGNLSSLEKLDISVNRFNGTFTDVIGQLKMLTDLDISYNSLEGAVSEVSFSNLTKLKHFLAKGNSFTLKTSRDWLPPFQLESLRLDSWHLGPEWPMWLRTQTQLKKLSLSGTGISSTIPTWFWNLTFHIQYLNLSHNQLYGQIQNIFGAYYSMVDLSSNQFTGALPIVPTTLYGLDLSNSSFSGSVFHFFCDRPDEPKQLDIVHLGNNFLTGKVPDCWMSWQSLSFLNLENNNLIGNVPMSMGYLQGLGSLHLRNNHLYGELPHSLQNCTWLSVVDLSENGFSGSIPIWIGKSLSELNVLNLRSNKFEGDIPNEVCYLKSLQILDLAHNKLSGMIPRCFHNLSALVNFSESFYGSWGLNEAEVSENAILVTKGMGMEYSNILGIVKVMDLSCNFMYGEIPEELTGLIALQSLNLSNNRFTGRIPSKIGSMAQLESLDFSMNQLDGEIPPSMTKLTFLSHLNLSYNNLTGRIPESTQLQSLDQSSFVGNELCGAPLNKNCSTNGVIPPPTVEQDGGGGYRLLEDEWFYVSLGVGFFTGFWIVLGSLLVNMPWSILLSQLLNRIVLKMYHVIVEYV
ncbi:receptor-like protein EIX1 [Malus sylvestris]|uniref:receptor-like protein EIX1 n=1 Tax=Malus sylvestris TaxID=3752 RepID=UPI0021AC169A|nr:receptor-like protein EIX1 [Malus sylvestris]